MLGHIFHVIHIEASYVKVGKSLKKLYNLHKCKLIFSNDRKFEFFDFYRSNLRILTEVFVGGGSFDTLNFVSLYLYEMKWEERKKKEKWQETAIHLRTKIPAENHSYAAI